MENPDYSKVMMELEKQVKVKRGTLLIYSIFLPVFIAVALAYNIACDRFIAILIFNLPIFMSLSFVRHLIEYTIVFKNFKTAKMKIMFKENEKEKVSEKEEKSN